MNTIVLFILIHWFVSLFFHTFFLHRYGTHGQFKMSPWWEKNFFIGTWIAMGSSFLNPRAYAWMHSEHHLYPDKEGDPHSPHRFANILTMMWATRTHYDKLLDFDSRTVASLPLEIRGMKTPEYPVFEEFAEGYLSRIMWVYIYVVIYTIMIMIYGYSWFWLFLLPLNILMGPIQGAMVNWFGHWWLGVRNFSREDMSIDVPMLNFVSLCETNQNRHHADPQNPNFGGKWWKFWEWDLVYPFIRLFNLMRIIELPVT